MDSKKTELKDVGMELIQIRQLQSSINQHTLLHITEELLESHLFCCFLTPSGILIKASKNTKG